MYTIMDVVTTNFEKLSSIFLLQKCYCHFY